MIDLNKIKLKFAEVLEAETVESFNEWLQEKQDREIFGFLGNFVDFSLPQMSIEVIIKEPIQPIYSDEYSSSTEPTDICYALAA